MNETDDGLSAVLRAWQEGLLPDPWLSVSEWSDEHRILSGKASAEPGRWRTSRTPYLKEIMDCLSPNSPVERVVFMKGAQIGATEMGANWIGYVIHHAPGPMMAVWPTVDLAKRNSKQRIEVLIHESPALRDRIASAKSKDSSNTILTKEFIGGILVMTGANSAVGLRSTPVRYLLLDEVDGYPVDVNGEGSAIALAEARTRTFSRRKILVISTPKLTGSSAIEREYDSSDQRRYFVPCPHCDHYQWLRFEQLTWHKGQPETAKYTCEDCSALISEHHKTQMLAAGQWRAQNPDSRTVGFHLSALYSPLGWRSWAQIAQAWESATHPQSGSTEAIKTFKNVELGETWLEDGEAPDWQRLLERREAYPIGQIPIAGLLLVAGVDVQKDRVEVSVWAWGRGKTCWLIEHRILQGQTSSKEVWLRLNEMIRETWTHQSGVLMRLSKIAIDSGYSTQDVYQFVRACNDPRVMAVKGSARAATMIGTPMAVDVSSKGKRLKRGIKVTTVGVDIIKQDIYNCLRKVAGVEMDGRTPVYPDGYVHLPMVDTEYLQQLCAEQLMTRRNRHGYAIREWQKMRDRNEALDCFVYARAAAAAIGLDRMEERHWRGIEHDLGMMRFVPPGQNAALDFDQPLLNDVLTSSDEVVQVEQDDSEEVETQENTPRPPALLAHRVAQASRRIRRSSWLKRH